MRWTVLLALGCSPKASDSSTQTGAASVVDNAGNGSPSDGGTSADEDADADAGADADEPNLAGLNGRVIDPPLPAIDFSAVNRDGSERSRSDLLDKRTVMWFYPAAGTYG